MALLVGLLLVIAVALRNSAGFANLFETSNASADKWHPHELELVKAIILSGNMKLTRPALPVDNSTLVIKTRLYLVRIQNIIEAKETLYSTIRLQLNWEDPALSWSPEKYGGRNNVVIPGGRLWVPDLHIANSVDFAEDFLGDKGTFPFRVTSSGGVWYHPTGVAKTRCKFDLTYYPFDVQCCMIIVESVIFMENELKLETRTDEESPNAVSFGMFAENEVWEVDYNYVGGISTVFRSGKRTAFSRINFWMVLRRKPTFVVVTAVIPSIILGVITLLTYLVPVHYVERPSQSVTTVLTVAIFEVMVAEKLPDNSANCLLTIYLTVILCASAINIFTTTMCLVIVDPGQFISAPWGIPNVIRAIARLCGCRADDVDFSPFEEVAKINSDVAPPIPSAYRLANNNPPRYHPEQITDNLPRYVKNTSKKRLGHANNDAAGSSLERNLSTSRKAWYVAYAINWIGFTTCLMAMLSIPVYAYFTIPTGMSHHVANDTMGLEFAYYGD